jgi:hypothetical protein
LPLSGKETLQRDRVCWSDENCQRSKYISSGLF